MLFKHTDVVVKDGDVENNLRCRKAQTTSQQPSVHSGAKKKSKCLQDKAMFVEVCSRIGFPLVFIVFNLIYWIYYLFLVV